MKFAFLYVVWKLATTTSAASTSNLVASQTKKMIPGFCESLHWRLRKDEDQCLIDTGVYLKQGHKTIDFVETYLEIRARQLEINDP